MTTTETPTSLRADAEALLRELAGPDARLREDQWTAIEALVVHRRRALVVQRTGWGKSAVYFISAKLLRAQGRGPTVIVSPLLALMRNQVAAAQRAGVRAATINSGNVTEWDEIHAQVADGTVDVLLVSPERLNNPDFRDQVLPAPGRRRRVGGGRRGALRVGLGARFPAGLPAHPHPRRRPRRRHPGARDHRHRQRPGCRRRRGATRGRRGYR